MDDWSSLRVLAGLGFTRLLVMLRLEAERFGAAEYEEIDRYGGRPPLLRRLAWYILGSAASWHLLTIHPSRSST